MPTSPTPNDRFATARSTYLELYRRHLTDDVIAWWLAHAVDDEKGGVFSCWSNDGTELVSRDKYTWSQGRWAWMMARFSAAARRGLLELDGATCRRRAEQTAALLRDYALLGDGATAYALDPSGAPKETIAGRGFHTSVFADLFVLLGLAAVAAETGSREWAELADGILAAAHERIAAGPVPSEPHPTPAGFSGLDMMMTLVGTGTEVYRATRSEKAAATVAWAVQQLESTFVRGADVLELAPEDPALGDTLLARHRTPGHVLEACWFLMDAADTIPVSLRPATDLFDPGRLADIAARAFDLGWDEEMDGLLCFVDKDGSEPRGRALGDRLEKLVVATWDTKLWWPNGEALYTLLLLGLRAGRDDLLERHARLHDYVTATFPAGPGREWIQIRDRAGKPVNQIVALPVKDPFHIARALLLCVELLAGSPHES